MNSLNARIAALEKHGGTTQPFLIYDDGRESAAREKAIVKAQNGKRAVIRISPIDAAL
jgi:hypothetical protein